MGYGGDSCVNSGNPDYACIADVSSSLSSGASAICSAGSAFAALKTDGKLVTWGETRDEAADLQIAADIGTTEQVATLRIASDVRATEQVAAPLNS